MSAMYNISKCHCITDKSYLLQTDPHDDVTSIVLYTSVGGHSV